MDFSGRVNGLEMKLLSQSNYKVWKTCMKSYLVSKDLWDVVNGSNTSPPDDGSENSNATLDYLFNKKNKARLQIFENELRLLRSTNKKNSHSWFEARIYSICDVDSRMGSTTILGGELLAKQLASVFVKEGEENALVANKRNFKGKTRDVPHSRSSGGSHSPGEKKESSNYYGKKPIRCYQCGEVGHIKRYCRANESNMDKKVVEEEKEDEEWGNCLVAEARAIDAMISINTEKGWIEDIEYNIADHMEKQEIDVVSMKQEIFEDILIGNRVVAIDEIKEEDLEPKISETICVSGDLYRESIEGDVLETKVSGQSSTISRSTNYSKQILKADGESRDQIEKEADIEVLKTNDMIFESSETANKFIEEMIREYGSGSYVGVDTSQVSDAEKLRERGSSKTQQGDNLHGPFDNGKSLSFEEAKGVQKKILRFSPRRNSKLYLSSSMTSVG
ncbi:hypothetical protein KY284_021540 [Solanum tuberosum]|nr:hypothetical protein KY284_021540 [Solanum tuberosum]